MRTDDLIQALAADARPEGATDRRVLPWLLPAVVLSLAGLLVTMGARPDLAHALTTFVPAMRHVLTLSLFGLALAAALITTRPEGRARLWPLAVVATAALAMLLWAYATTPPGARVTALMGTSYNICVLVIPLMSILPVAALFTALRSGASTTPTLTGALIGLAGGGAGAAVYAVHCTESSPLFYVTWYGLAILAVTAVSALIGRRVLRW
ncbi:MAG: DUF1109 domain-containing protein [Paracoccaceae bacterium]